ncbi:MAG: CvpA family protein, partial [Bacilli bacterium]|nr:CvpA family protein [Bacilli bacterium]
SDYMTIMDSIIILFLLAGAVLGFKKGAIKSLVALVGTIALVVIAYYLKNPVADIMFNFVPFVNFAGKWAGLVTLNILLYESLAYILVFVVLSSILSIFIKVSGIIEKILNATIILGIPSKIIGAVLGFLEAVVFGFIVLFALVQFNATNELVMESSMAKSILSKTPIINIMVNDTYKAIQDIGALQDKYKDVTNKDDYNAEILDIMLNYEVVTPEVTEKLIENKKLDFNGAKETLNKYKEKNND